MAIDLFPEKRRHKPGPAPEIDLTLEPEEKANLLRQLQGGVLSTLGWIAETLDKPGRAVRGLLAGRPEELLNLIPFSDTMGLTDPAQQVTGRELLEKAGILRKNTPGLDFGDVAGFAAEVILDPTVFIGGPAKAAIGGAAKLGSSVAAKAARSAARAATASVAAKSGAIAQKAMTAAQSLLPPGTTAASVARQIDEVGRRAVEAELHREVDRAVRDAMSNVAAPDHKVIGGRPISATGAIISMDRAFSATAPRLPGHLSTPARMAEEIAAGERGLITVRNPFTGRQYLTLFTGPRAAEFYKFVAYNPASNVLRTWFASGHEGLRGMADEHFWADLRKAKAYDMHAKATAFLADTNADVMALRHMLQAATGYDSTVLAQLNDGLDKLVRDATELHGFIPADAQQIRRNASNAIRPLAQRKAELRAQLRSGTLSPADILRARQELAVIQQQIDSLKQQRADADAIARQNYESALLDRIDNYARSIGASTNALGQLFQELDGLAQQIGGFLDQTWAARRHMGAKGPYLHEYFPRKATAMLRGSAKEMLRPVLSGSERVAPLVHGGLREAGATTNMINQVTLDNLAAVSNAELVKALDDFDLHEVAERAIHARTQGQPGTTIYSGAERVYRTPITGRQVRLRDPNPVELKEHIKAKHGLREGEILNRDEILKAQAKNQPPPPERTSLDEFSEYLQRLPAEVLLTGLFGRSAIKDLAEGVAGQLLDASMLRNMHHYVQQHARTFTPGDAIPSDWHPIMRVFDKLGLDPERAFDYMIAAARHGSTPLGRSPGFNHFAQAVHNAAANNMPPADIDAIVSRWKEHILMPDEAAHGLMRLMKHTGSPETASVIGKAYDKVLGVLKSGMTFVGGIPAFQIRNLLSGMWYNLMTVIDDPASFMRATTRAVDFLRGKDPHTLEIIKPLGLLEGTQADEVIHMLGSTESVQAPRLREFSPLEPVARARRLAARGYARGTFALPPGVGPARRTLSGLAGSAGQLFAGEYIPGRLSEPGLGGVGMKLNKAVEIFNRMQHYYAAIDKGLPPAAAVRSAILAHFDYGDLSRFEKTYMRRLMPFYAFTRKNIPALIANLINQPGGRLAQFIRLQNALRKKDRPSRGAEVTAADLWIPSWLGEGLAIRMESRDPKYARFLSEYGLFPTSDLNILPFVGGRPDWRSAAENVLARTSPVIQGPLGLMAGRQFWSHRDIQDLYQDPFTDPATNYMFFMSPLGRAATRTRQLFDPRKTAIEKAINLLVGGIRLTDVEIEKSINLEMRDALEKLMRIEPGLKQYSRVYISDPGKLSEEARKNFALYRLLLDEYRQYKKAQRESEEE